MNTQTVLPFEGIKLETSVLCKHKKIAGRVESIFCEADPVRLSEASSLKRLGPGCCTACSHKSNCSCLWEKDSNSNSKLSNDDLRNRPSAGGSHNHFSYAPFEESMLYRLQRRHFYCGNMHSNLMQVIKKPVPKMYFSESEESLVATPSAGSSSAAAVVVAVQGKKNSSKGIGGNGTNDLISPSEKVSDKLGFAEQTTNRQMDVVVGGKPEKECGGGLTITKIGRALIPRRRKSNLLAKSKTSSRVNAGGLGLGLTKKSETTTKHNECRYIDHKNFSKQNIFSTPTLPQPQPPPTPRSRAAPCGLDYTQKFFPEARNPNNSKRTESFLQFLGNSTSHRGPARTIDSLEDMIASKGKIRFPKPLDSEEPKIEDGTSTKANKNSAQAKPAASADGGIDEGQSKLVNWDKDTLSSLTVQIGTTDSKSTTRTRTSKKQHVEKVKSATKNGQKKKQSKENIKAQHQQQSGVSKNSNATTKGKRNNLDLNANNENGIVPPLSKLEISGVKKLRNTAGLTEKPEKTVRPEESLNLKSKFSHKPCAENLKDMHHHHHHIKNSMLSANEMKTSSKGLQEFNVIKSKDSGMGSEQVLCKTESKKINGSASVSSKSAATRTTKKRKQKHHVQ